MENRSETAEKFFQLDIEGELSIFRAEELKEAILPVISNNDEIEIDLSRVTEIDGAGLQLMMSAKIEAWQQHKTLRFVGHSAPVTAAIDLCGLSTFFGDPIVISPKAA